jgi:hypothetical protein
MNSTNWALSSCITFALMAIVVCAKVKEAQQKPERVKIPVSMQRKMNSVNSTAEMLMKYVVRKPRPPGVSTQPAYPGENFLFYPNGSMNPSAANLISAESPSVDCQPRQSIVDLPPDNDTNVVLYPSCADAMRCSGCCDEMFECMATSTITTWRKVSRLEYNAATDDFEFVGFVDVPVVEHRSCMCSCLIQPYNCTPDIHWYDPQACQCRCMATSQQCVSPKMWDESVCACVCPSLSYCLEDEVYDFQACSCVLRSVIAPSQSGTNWRRHDRSLLLFRVVLRTSLACNNIHCTVAFQYNCSRLLLCLPRYFYIYAPWFIIIRDQVLHFTFTNYDQANSGNLQSDFFYLLFTELDMLNVCCIMRFWANTTLNTVINTEMMFPLVIQQHIMNL